MAVKVALDMNIFPVLADASSPVPLAKLAAAKPADPLLVGQSRHHRTLKKKYLAAL